VSAPAPRAPHDPREPRAARVHETNVAQGVLLPCLRILARVTALAPGARAAAAPPPALLPEAGRGAAAAAAAASDPLRAALARQREPPALSYGQWQPDASPPQDESAAGPPRDDGTAHAGGLSFAAFAQLDAAGRRRLRLARKFGARWLARSPAGRRRAPQQDALKSVNNGISQQGGEGLLSARWVRELLLCKCSQVRRRAPLRSLRLPYPRPGAAVALSLRIRARRPCAR